MVMVTVDLQLLKKLRLKTGASIADCRLALEETNGDEKNALEWLKKRGLEKAVKKSDRETLQGLITSYIHNDRIGVLVEILCETDFVAKTDEFRFLAKEIAMQISAMNPKNVEEVLKQEYIRDSSQTIEHVINMVIGKLGENIMLKRFTRFSLGE